MKYSEEPSDEKSTISPPPGERYREGGFAIQFTNSEHLRYVLSNRQFPTSAIYYQYHVGMKCNMPVTMRFW